MKTGLYSILYSIISHAAIICCFIPLLIIVYRKLQNEKAYLFTALYWLLNGLLNTPTLLGFGTNHALNLELTLLYNLLDAPVVLLVFMFSTTGVNRKIIRWTLLAFLLFEASMIAWKGYNMTSSTIIIGAGTFFAIAFSIMKVMEYLQKMEHNSQENSMVFVYGSFLFDYGIFIVIYLFSYLGVGKNNFEDTFMIYYISMLISTLLSSLGLWMFAGKPELQEPGSLNSYSRL